MNRPVNLSGELDGASVIVTGASGFIGLNLVRVLAGLGAEVTVIDRVQPSQRLPNVHFEWGDLRHLDQIYEADYLIHLAAITNAGFAERYPIDTYEVNVLGTVNLMNHVKINKRVLFPSTALTYEASRTPISEEAPVDLSSTYALSKNMGEQVIKFHCNRMGVGHTPVVTMSGRLFRLGDGRAEHDRVGAANYGLAYVSAGAQPAIGYHGHIAAGAAEVVLPGGGALQGGGNLRDTYSHHFPRGAGGAGTYAH